MVVAYVRVSTAEQNEARQLEALEKFNIEKWFAEKVSGKDTKRPKLQAMLDFVREGDVVDVTYASYRTDENGETLVDADGNYVRYDDEESSDTSTRIYVGSRAFLADFEKNLVNARVGEMVTFKITFPADYDNEELRTKTLAYEVKINSVYDAPKYDLSFIQANYGEHQEERGNYNKIQ